MSNNIATTKEQSARLLACGVPPETADMAWVNCKETADDGLAWETDELVSWPYTRAASTFDTPKKKKATPAWSLGALLEKVLPKQLKDFPLETVWDADGDETELSTPHMLDGDIVLNHNGTIWEVDYGFIGRLPQSKESLIEAAVQAVELLHLNGYKFN